MSTPAIVACASAVVFLVNLWTWTHWGPERSVLRGCLMLLCLFGIFGGIVGVAANESNREQQERQAILSENAALRARVEALESGEAR